MNPIVASTAYIAELNCAYLLNSDTIHIREGKRTSISIADHIDYEKSFKKVAFYQKDPKVFKAKTKKERSKH